MSVSNSDDKPVRLSLRVAGEVAWKSIKVRLSRSLVTVSSVVLAVAFLLNVLGGDIASRAVFVHYEADSRPARQGAVLQNALKRRRPATELMRLYSVAPDLRLGADTMTAWMGEMGIAEPASPELTYVAMAHELATWVETLKATDRFKALENRPLIDWLLDLDSEPEIDTFMERSRTFRGVRLPFEREQLVAMANEMPVIAALTEDLRRAERERLDRLSGLEDRSQLLVTLRESGNADAAYTTLLPLDQLIGGLASQIINAPVTNAGLVDGDLERLRHQLRIDDIKARTQRAIEATNEAEVREASREQRDPRVPLTLAQLADQQLPDDDRAGALEQRLSDSINAEERSELMASFAQSERNQVLGQTFRDMGYNPNASGGRSFWLLVLSLLVCVVGIVNSMMMAVTERFREIATMKCLGAMDSFILKAFLIESGSVGLIGSLVGVVLGVVIVLLQATVRFGGPFWSAFPFVALLAAAGIALVCGLILTIAGALLPAYKAARMHPIEAMRLEA